MHTYLNACLMKQLSLLLAIIIGLPSFALAGDDLKSKAAKYFDKGEEERALETYKKVLEDNNDDVEVLWQSAMLYTRVGDRLDDESQKQEYFEIASELIERAKHIDDENADVYFTQAVILGRKADHASTEDALKKAEEIRKYSSKALEVDSEHEGALHVLGLWHKRMANLSFAERSIVNTLFGGVPEDASNDKAKEYLSNAARLDTDMILYQLDLAKFHSEYGNPDEAKQLLEKIQNLDPRFKDDPYHKDEAEELLTKL